VTGYEGAVADAWGGKRKGRCVEPGMTAIKSMISLFQPAYTHKDRFVELQWSIIYFMALGFC